MFHVRKLLVNSQIHLSLIRISRTTPEIFFCLDFVRDFGFPKGMQGRAQSPEEMESLGKSAADAATPGTVIGLVGDLGAGKTHWTKGFTAGMGSAADVTSPTFGLLHEYHGGRLPTFHLDFYRLETAEELIALGWDELLEQEGVIIAEWADKFPHLLPPETIWLRFQVKADGSRTVTRSASPD